MELTCLGWSGSFHEWVCDSWDKDVANHFFPLFLTLPEQFYIIWIPSGGNVTEMRCVTVCSCSAAHGEAPGDFWKTWQDSSTSWVWSGPRPRPGNQVEGRSSTPEMASCGRPGTAAGLHMPRLETEGHRGQNHQIKSEVGRPTERALNWTAAYRGRQRDNSSHKAVSPLCLCVLFRLSSTWSSSLDILGDTDQMSSRLFTQWLFFSAVKPENDEHTCFIHQKK